MVSNRIIDYKLKNFVVPLHGASVFKLKKSILLNIYLFKAYSQLQFIYNKYLIKNQIELV